MNLSEQEMMTGRDDTRHRAAVRFAAERQQIVQNRIKREKAQLMRDWLAGGGTAADFEDAWPAIHAQLGQIRVQEIGDRARTRSLTAFHRRH